MFGDDPVATNTQDQSTYNSTTDANSPGSGYDNGFMPPANDSQTDAGMSSDPSSTASFTDAQSGGAPTTVQPTDHNASNGHSGSQAAPQLEDGQSSELLSIKQEALSSLTPLVGHLEQSPEEKFRTLMMMIQASDDHSKLKEAYDTAKQISDDKERAQALLDVINEINYFTHQEAHQN